MKRSAFANLCLSSSLVLLVLAVRWVGAHEDWDLFPPNFTPVAAVGLFAGFVFRSRLLALFVSFASLVLSNLFLDSYGSWAMTAAVYGCFLSAPLFGRILRRRMNWQTACVCTVLPSVIFFAVTNLAQWLVDAQHMHRMYAAGWSGLAACYAAGIPFFRWMVEGDVVFTAMLFGAYVAATAMHASRRRERVAVRSR
jgi:hypothetical protein